MPRNLVTLAVVAALFALPAAAPAQNRRAPAKQPTAVGTGGAAATVDPVATRAAIDGRRRGGNAIDAAVAAAGVLGVVEPYSCGIGGGGFMTIYSARDRVVHTIDSRETAPAAMTPTAFTGLTRFESQRVSGMSVGVPGTVRAWETALRQFCPLALRHALQPGIAAARRGFVVDQTFFDQTNAARGIFGDFPATAALYLDRDGTPHDVGTVIRNRALARTYALLARDGADAFYHGRLARAIVNTVRRPPLRTGTTRVVRPGVMTLSDLARSHTVNRVPTPGGSRGLPVIGMGPPSSGGATVGEALTILERFPLGQLPRADAMYDYLEASRLAFADRGAWLGDPAFFNARLRGLLPPSFAAERPPLIGPGAPAGPAPPGAPRDNAPPPADTS